MLLEDTADHRRARTEAMKVTTFDRFRQVQAQGIKMSELVADPRWEIYGRYIETERANHEASAKGIESKLLDDLNPLEPHEERKARLHLAHNRAAIEAYTLALSIAKTLIERGQAAEAEIARMVFLDNQSKTA